MKTLLDHDEEELSDAGSWQAARSREFSQYNDFCHRELPGLVRKKVEQLAQRESKLLEERLKSQIVQILESAHDELFSRYDGRCPSLVPQSGSQIISTDEWLTCRPDRDDTTLADLDQGNISGMPVCNYCGLHMGWCGCDIPTQEVQEKSSSTVTESQSHQSFSFHCTGLSSAEARSGSVQNGSRAALFDEAHWSIAPECVISDLKKTDQNEHAKHHSCSAPEISEFLVDETDKSWLNIPEDVSKDFVTFLGSSSVSGPISEPNSIVALSEIGQSQYVQTIDYPQLLQQPIYDSGTATLHRDTGRINSGRELTEVSAEELEIVDKWLAKCLIFPGYHPDQSCTSRTG